MSNTVLKNNVMYQGSIPGMSHAHALGMRTDITGSIQWIDENSIIYPCGNNIVVYNKEHKTTKFQPLTDRGDGISAISISPDKRFLAVAEKSNAKMPFLVIYDMFSMRKRRGLSPGVPECRAKEFTHISFSSDAKFCVAILGEPQNVLHYYLWESGKIFAIKNIFEETKAKGKNGIVEQPKILQVDLNPKDSTLMSVLGESFVKMYKYTSGELDLVPLDWGYASLENTTFKCQTWLSADRLAIGTNDGRIFILQNGSLLQMLNINPPVMNVVSIDDGENITQDAATSGSEQQDSSSDSTTTPVKTFSVECIKGNDSRFLVGSSDCFLYAYKASDGLEHYRDWKKVHLPEKDMSIKQLAFSVDDKSCLVVVNKCQLLSIHMTSLESAKLDEIKLETLSQSYHHGPVMGIDTCWRKPLMVTCSPDKSVRIWNYVNGTCELSRTFSEEAYSVAFHPSGLYLLIGFSDKLRLMNVLNDDIRLFREFPVRGCRECRFSTGGQYFAVANGNVIQLYNTWTMENVANLKGHNGKVKSLYWSPDDRILVSAGTDGAVYSWNVREKKRETEHILKNCQYYSAACSQDGKVVWAAGTDKMVKEIDDSIVAKEVDFGAIHTQLLISHSGRLMFGGTNNGTLRAIRFPISGFSHDYEEHFAHSSSITKISISHDDQYLFSASEDGCIFVFRVIDKDERAIRNKERAAIVSEEILVTRSDLEEKAMGVAELRRTLEELKLEHEYQLRLKDMNFSEKIKEITDKYTGEIEKLKITTTVLRTEKDKEEVRHDEELSQLKEKNENKAHEFESKYNQQLMDQYDKFQELHESSSKLQVQWEKEVRDVEKEHQRILSVTTAEYEWKLRSKVNEINKLSDQLNAHIRECNELQRQSEEDIESEIKILEERYEKKLKTERDECARLKGENGIMKKKFITLTKEIEDQKHELAKLLEDDKKLRSVMTSLEKDIEILRGQMNERDEMIQEKERKIYGLKKKNQELEKYKFVLDYRIKEIKSQIEPRENDISEMTSHIQDMSNELDDLSKHKEKLEKVIGDLKTKLTDSKKDYQKEHERSQKMILYIGRMKNDLVHAVGFIQEPALLSKALRNIQKTYCQNVDKLYKSTDPNVITENKRQKEFLESTIRQLSQIAHKRVEVYHVDDIARMKDNQQLLVEINEMRKNKREKKAAESSLRLPHITANNNTTKETVQTQV